MKKTLALCTPIPEKQMEYIKEQCDITICGELKHGKGNTRNRRSQCDQRSRSGIILYTWKKPCCSCRIYNRTYDRSCKKTDIELYRIIQGRTCRRTYGRHL